jgi:hypothetical protein
MKPKDPPRSSSGPTVARPISARSVSCWSPHAALTAIVVATNHDGIVRPIDVVAALIAGLYGLVILVPLPVVVGIVDLVKPIT